MNEPLKSHLLADAWAELQRRKVVRAAAAYAVVAWVFLQLGEITFDPLGLPERALTWLILAAILGFPLVLVISWFYDLGPRGLTRDRSRASRGGAVSAVALVLITVLAMGAWLVEVYPPEASTAPMPVATRSLTPSVPANSIAVLPFKDMSEAGDQGYLADGIAEELLDRLARVPQLRVAARTSSFAVREADIKDIGRVLDVRWVLEGSVRKSGGRLRITAQLIDASNGYHQWSETYDREEGDLFALQDAVSIAIAEQLQVVIPNAAVTELAGNAGESADPAAHDAFLRGRQLWRQRTPASLQQAETLFFEATQRDPEFARAWSGLADAYLLQADYGVRPTDEAIRLAEPAAVRAVTLAPQLGEAWASIGLLRMFAGQLPAAERSLRQAISLDPRYEMAPMWLASTLGRKGELDEEERVLRQALALNPLEPVINANLSQALVQRGAYDEAESLLQRVLAVTPDDPLLLRGLSLLQGSRGELAAALGSIRRAQTSDPDAPATLRAMIGILVDLRAFDEARAVASRLPEGTDARLEVEQLINVYSDAPEVLPAVSERLTNATPEQLEAHKGLLATLPWVGIVGGRTDEAMHWLRLRSPAEGSTDRAPAEVASLMMALRGETPVQDDSERAYWSGLLERPRELGFLPGGAQYNAAAIHCLLDDRQAALDALDLAIDLGFRNAEQARVDPRLEPLRGHPRFEAAVQRIGELVAEQRRLAGF